MGLRALFSCLVAGAAAGRLAWPELLPEYDPVADPAAVVSSGCFRATVLTDRVLRFEYSRSGAFEDRATTVFVNRKLPVPKFTVASRNGRLTIATSHVVASWDEGGAGLSSLSAAPANGSSAGFRGWRYGDRDGENLLGTIRSLDELGPTSLNCTSNANITVHDEGLHCAWGLVSRSGWAVVDDSETWSLDASGWWREPNKDDVDVYLFAHGFDYAGALKDYSKVAGRAAMPPRAAFGTWWTRWYNINAPETIGIVEAYRSRELPLDVFVYDMDWHVKPAWGAYSWDSNLFPDPSDVVKGYLKDTEGLVTLANLHDDDGVVEAEDAHAAMVAAMGLPASTGDVPFRICDSSRYAAALEDAVLAPLEAQGLDYWWIDWQQGGRRGGCAGGAQNPTIWTNKIRATDHLRRGSSKRGLILARWGGLGSHRYPVGFSGDVKEVTWATLAYQPYFSATAANVAYGYWSHDVLGPSGASEASHELYTRWVQWAAFSGVFRSHDRGLSAGACAGAFPPTVGSDACGVVEPWRVPTPYFEANRAAMRRRAAMVPYIYTLARQLFDEGLGPLRPLYYEYPNEDAAYARDEFQYLFGPDLVVAPVVKPSTPGALATKRLWVPPGAWVEETSGRLFRGATFENRSYALAEIPVLVRAGAVLPSLPRPRHGNSVGAAAKPYTALILSVYPGADAGGATVYQDDGATTAYTQGASAFLVATYMRSKDGQSIVVTVATAGTFPELPPHQDLTLRLVNAGPVAAVAVDGKAAACPFRRSFSRDSAAGLSWTYDGAAAAAEVRVPAVSTRDGAVIEVTFAAGAAADAASLAGVRGLAARGTAAKAVLDAVRRTPGAQEGGFGALDRLAILGDDLSRLAGDVAAWKAALGGAAGRLADAVSEVAKTQNASDPRTAYVAALLEV